MFCCETCECKLFYLKIAANIINKIVLQDELPIILTVEICDETQIKGQHVYKDIWTLELGEHLEVQCELENPVDMYAVCLKTSNGTIVGHLKKKNLRVLQRPFFIIYEVTLKQITQLK